VTKFLCYHPDISDELGQSYHSKLQNESLLVLMDTLVLNPINRNKLQTQEFNNLKMFFSQQ
jgi:hypothetical protein